MALHRAGQADAEWLCGKHQWSATVEADQAAKRLCKIDSEYDDVHFPSPSDTD